MATIRKSFDIAAPAARVWDALADFHNVHLRLAPGFVTACAAEGDCVRLLTFANGATARETLVAADPVLRRLVYVAAGERLVHHNAAAEIVATDTGRCRFIWTTDVLPDALAPYIAAQMDAGAKAIKAALER